MTPPFNTYYRNNYFFMAPIKCRVSSPERRKTIHQAIAYFNQRTERSIRAAALTYDLPYPTLRDRLRGAKKASEAHVEQQIISTEQRKALVRFCEALDDLGHPMTLKMLREFALSMLPPWQERKLGVHWTSRFLDRNKALAAKFSQRLDRQRANANDPIILKDFFRKVSDLWGGG